MMQLEKRDLEQVAGAASIGTVHIEKGGIANIIIIVPPMLIKPEDSVVKPEL